MPRRNLAALLAGALPIAACNATAVTSTAPTDSAASVTAQTAGLFDASAVHSVAIEFDTAAYDAIT